VTLDASLLAEAVRSETALGVVAACLA